MYTYRINKLPKNTNEIIVDIPKVDIKLEFDKSFDKLQKELTVEGFRKGKAPKAVAEKHLKKELIIEDLAKTLFSRIYSEIVKKENLKPIVSPKIDLIKAKEDEDWQIKISLAERPAINLGEYKKSINNLKANNKKADIWVPGKGSPTQSQQKSSQEDKQKSLNDILTLLLKECQMDISDLILEEELNHRLTKLVDDVQKLGLTVESYLKSKKITIEELKKRYRQEIEDTYKIEFLLTEIADKENINVEKEDLDKLFSNIKDEKEKQSAQQNAYFYAAFLRKQKTLDFLLSL